MKNLSFALIFALGSATVFAQQAPPPAREPLPDGPLLARAPEFSQWTVVIKPVTPPTTPATAHAKTGDLTSTVTKTRDVYFQEFADAFGRKWKTWVADKLQATISPDNGAIILGEGGDGQLSTDYSKTDFQGLEWVSADNFVKTSTFEGRKCLVFSVALTVPVAAPLASADRVATGASAATPSAPAARTELATGVVDFDSRLPLYAQKGSTSYRFKFGSPPQVMLQVPADIMKLVQQQGKRAHDITARVPRGY